LKIRFNSLLHCYSVISVSVYFTSQIVIVMKKATTALFVVLMFVFSCTKESVSPDLDSGYDVLKKADATKNVTKTLKFHESSGTMGPVGTGDCITGWQYLVSGTGHATHLGAFTVQNTACCLGPPYFQPVESLQGILTAANGDQIFTVVDHIYDGGDLGDVYHYHILMGNGRFEGALGYIDMWGLIDYDLGIFDLQGLGEITY